jgi:hypothetical protein
MRNGYDLLRTWMREMVVTAGRSKMHPSGIAQLPDDCAAVHYSNDVDPQEDRQGARLEAHA